LLLKVVHCGEQDVRTGEKLNVRLTAQGEVEDLLEVTTRRFNSSKIFLMAANEADNTFFKLEGHDRRQRYDQERRVLDQRRHLWEATDVLTHP
jgi:hypothetical protein